MMAEKEEQLHRIARRATLRGEFDDAIQCYQHAIDSFGSSRSFLLAALLLTKSALGWKGRPELGEDPTLWYDDEGERKGPPLNYWRQSMDERLHGRCFDAVDAVLESSSGSGVSLGEVDGEVDSEDGLRALEYRMSITRPMRNRKLLGRWAPIVVDGAVVAKAAEAAETSQSREYVAGQGPAYLVPEMWDIAREGGRKTVAHRYGEQDMHLEEGEIMRLTVSSSPEASDEQVLSATVEATASKERFTLDLAAEGEGSKATVYVGGVSFLNEYLLVARDAEGALSELFVRVDAP